MSIDPTSCWPSWFSKTYLNWWIYTIEPPKHHPVSYFTMSSQSYSPNSAAWNHLTNAKKQKKCSSRLSQPRSSAQLNARNLIFYYYWFHQFIYCSAFSLSLISRRSLGRNRLLSVKRFEEPRGNSCIFVKRGLVDGEMVLELLSDNECLPCLQVSQWPQHQTENYCVMYHESQMNL